MKTVAIIQARMGSTRLPGKIMKNLYGKSVLQHVIERVQQTKNIDSVVIATTALKQDDIVVDEAVKCGVRFFRGSENDVLERYYLAAKENNADIVIRITSDCPLIDPFVTSEIVNFYKEHSYDIVTNAGADMTQRTYPRGLDTEVFSAEILEKAFYNAEKPHHREHVTPYIYENSTSIYYYKGSSDYSNYRWTLDTKEDLLLIKTIYSYLYKGQHNFYFQDILHLIHSHPQLLSINAHIEQKKL